jgi:hypothetical protein
VPTQKARIEKIRAFFVLLNLGERDIAGPPLAAV